MKETEAIIERVRRVNAHFQRLELALDDALMDIKPGQTLLARVEPDTWHPYLNQHWWPVAKENGRLVVELPTGKRYEPGQIVTVMGLVGQPYRFRRSLRNVLLLAYETPPIPLLMPIPALLSNKISVTLVLLGSARSYRVDHLPPEVEIITGDDEDDPLNWANQVMTVGWADQVFAVVGERDEYGYFKQILDRFQDRRTDIPQNYLFGVFRPVLPCGVGACHACMLSMKNGTPLVCVDGPAFDLTQVIW